MRQLPLGILFTACLVCVSGCSNSESEPKTTKTSAPTRTGAIFRPLIPADQRPDQLNDVPVSPNLRDVAADVGLLHVYKNGATGKLLMVESIGGGCAWLDYDRDGQLDAIFVQGGPPVTGIGEVRPADQLFRQVRGEFESSTAAAFFEERSYSQGVAVGDFDEDGFPDLYVTNVGTNTLWQNQGDGTFLEVTQAAGVGDQRWSSSAAWADLDQDGDLDLYVCNYLKYFPADPLECLKNGKPALCHPRQLPHWPDECYLNQGDGTFRAVSSAWSLQGEGNKALGVAIADFNNDGWPDIYVANDTTANFLFLNMAGQGFEEKALRLGCALNADGAAQASMGIGVGDYDANGRLDVFLSHFTGESNTLFQNLGESGLVDVSARTGIQSASWNKLGFGTLLLDIDQNGTFESLTANGHIDENNADGDGYEQQPQLLTYANGRWHDISQKAGPYFSGKYVGRGLSAGDFDNDGDLDLLVVHQNAPAALLQNDSQRGSWLQLRFIGRQNNRFGIGCRAKLRMGDQTLMSELIGGTSFASTNEPTVVFGLGDWKQPVQVEIIWPGGHRQTLPDVAVNQALTIVEDR